MLAEIKKRATHLRAIDLNIILQLEAKVHANLETLLELRDEELKLLVKNMEERLTEMPLSDEEKSDLVECQSQLLERNRRIVELAQEAHGAAKSAFFTYLGQRALPSPYVGKSHQQERVKL